MRQRHSCMLSKFSGKYVRWNEDCLAFWIYSFLFSATLGARCARINWWWVWGREKKGGREDIRQTKWRWLSGCAGCTSWVDFNLTWYRLANRTMHRPYRDDVNTYHVTLLYFILWHCDTVKCTSSCPKSIWVEWDSRSVVRLVYRSKRWVMCVCMCCVCTE